MMDALLRKDRWRYSLLIALAIVGLEIDVFSNPFAPEFVLCRLSSVLDESTRDRSAIAMLQILPGLRAGDHRRIKVGFDDR